MKSMNPISTTRPSRTTFSSTKMDLLQLVSAILLFSSSFAATIVRDTALNPCGADEYLGVYTNGTEATVVCATSNSIHRRCTATDLQPGGTTIDYAGSSIREGNTTYLVETEALPDAHTSCVFDAKPNRNIASCASASNIGKFSAHNCKNRGGKQHLCRYKILNCGACSCTSRYVTLCGTVSYWTTQNAENGYCFTS